ncbi:hypothetical protein PF010_g30571 [Phytophthora fragariae]|uniref:Uncharacterized protein n=1 Tax=Phytophthora fragariae TaxID=53985 RepID=A0A6A3DH81_9STRA|nr:hypothetical protein PF003_g13082 [Phytophthora fragariae]KAE8918271.1 hypothetical protein PF009_g31413 [Phytophthora fragariae]KAE9059556.1 hypothetical protein PF010_g30571 [Phytophthora fragariae]KAE9062631.1 hypothetical protein PF006_g31123 [Phytophthora fragariae]KAE9264912.1 hypothetical protein PF001_g31100 [Phytophthora fragariae]
MSGAATLGSGDSVTSESGPVEVTNGSITARSGSIVSVSESKVAARLYMVLCHCRAALLT